jgi:hypothetical protein
MLLTMKERGKAPPSFQMAALLLFPGTGEANQYNDHLSTGLAAFSPASTVVCDRAIRIVCAQRQ